MPPIRQGDVILLSVQQTEGRRLPHLTLAEGEVTGHSHRNSQGQAELYKQKGTLYLRVLSDVATLTHEEHKAIICSPRQLDGTNPARIRATGMALCRTIEESNAERRRVLIQAIGCARICQELQTSELDSWQECERHAENLKRLLGEKATISH